MSVPLGLIAGEGVFPLLVARGARAAGRRVVCCAFAGHAWPELRQECEQFEWVGITRIGRWIRVLRQAGCHEAIMVGRVAKSQMYDRWRQLLGLDDAALAELKADCWRWYVGTLDQPLFDWFAGRASRRLARRAAHLDPGVDRGHGSPPRGEDDLDRSPVMAR